MTTKPGTYLFINADGSVCSCLRNRVSEHPQDLHMLHRAAIGILVYDGRVEVIKDRHGELSSANDAARLVEQVERINGFRSNLSTVVGTRPRDATELSFVAATPTTSAGPWIALHWSSSSGYLVRAELRIALSEVEAFDDEKLKKHLIDLVKESRDLDLRDPQFRDELTRIGKPPRPREPRRPFPGRPPASTRVDKR